MFNGTSRHKRLARQKKLLVSGQAMTRGLERIAENAEGVNTNPDEGSDEHDEYEKSSIK